MSIRSDRNERSVDRAQPPVFTINPEFQIVMNKAMAVEIVDFLKILVEDGDQLPQSVFAMYRTLQSKVEE